MEMIQNVEIPEAVRVKLGKLRELAIRGVGGEAENAKRMLDALCERYGITVEEMFDDEKRLRSWRVRSTVVKLFLQLWTSLYGANARYLNEVKIYRTADVNYNIIEAPMTEAEYIELNNLWEWHRDNYQRERRRLRKLFQSAYIARYSLYPCEEDAEWEKYRDDSADRKKPDMAEVLAVSTLSNVISRDRNPHRQLSE